MSKTTDPHDRSLLTNEEGAGFLGVSPDTLAQWRSQRRGPRYIKLEGRIVRYRREDLEAYLKEHTILPLTGRVPTARLLSHEEKESGGGKSRTAGREGACQKTEPRGIV